MNDQVLSIEQMKELRELGIDTSKASMYISEYGEVIANVKIVELDTDWVPTFTLQNILEILPKNIINHVYQLYLIPLSSSWYIYYREGTSGEIEKSVEKNTLIEAAFNMLKWCKQNNHI